MTLVVCREAAGGPSTAQIVFGDVRSLVAHLPGDCLKAFDIRHARGLQQLVHSFLGIVPAQTMATVVILV